MLKSQIGIAVISNHSDLIWPEIASKSVGEERVELGTEITAIQIAAISNR